jgi:hypothetical protein
LAAYLDKVFPNSNVARVKCLIEAGDLYAKALSINAGYFRALAGKAVVNTFKSNSDNQLTALATRKEMKGLSTSDLYYLANSFYQTGNDKMAQKYIKSALATCGTFAMPYSTYLLYNACSVKGNNLAEILSATYEFNVEDKQYPFPSFSMFSRFQLKAIQVF